MSPMRFVYSIIVFVSIFIFSNTVFACESCSIAGLGRNQRAARSDSPDKKWFANYLYENQNWHEKDAREAHQLHDQGHHVHDKTSEEFHHLTIGGHLSERVIVFVEAPYVVRHSLEVEDHDILGSRQNSKGLGDMRLMGDYKVFNEEASSVSVVGGLKFPTGSTKEENSVGTRFESEMQPGTGSYDYILGGVYRRAGERASLVANTAYVFKTEGVQDFRYGDLLSTSLLLDYLLNPQEKGVQFRAGLDANLQYEQKQKDDGNRGKDSGGITLLLGPTLTARANEHFSLFGSFLAPVYQNLGGVHQNLDFVYTSGVTLNW